MTVSGPRLVLPDDGRTRLFRGSNGAEFAWLLFLNMLRALRLGCLLCVIQCKCYEIQRCRTYDPRKAFSYAIQAAEV